MWLTTVYFSYIRLLFYRYIIIEYFIFQISQQQHNNNINIIKKAHGLFYNSKRLMLTLGMLSLKLNYWIISWRWNKFGYRNILISLFMTNHLFIGILYIVYGLIGGSFGYGLSLILRIELALPGFIVCSSLQYYSIITFHGLFMIFFMIMPILIGGFGNFLIPLFLCSSDMIFPRLNATSLWLVFGSFILMCVAMYIEGGVNAGWTFYVPLSIINSSSVDLMFFITFSWIKFFIRIY